jgi:hypothetical protein
MICFQRENYIVYLGREARKINGVAIELAYPICIISFLYILISFDCSQILIVLKNIFHPTINKKFIHDIHYQKNSVNDIKLYQL